MTDALIMRAQSMIESTLSDRLDLRDTAILLVGSRAHARASETSDWDLLALASDNPPRETIELPRAEIELLGRDGRRARATVDLPIWQFELSHALLVHDGWAGVGAYCAAVATQFARRRHSRRARGPSFACSATKRSQVSTAAMTRQWQSPPRSQPETRRAPSYCGKVNRIPVTSGCLT